jgi:osmotically-inducible protein OsmY
MKTPLIILSSALVLVGCSRSDTDYSASSSTPSQPTDRYGSMTTNAADRSGATAAGGTAASRSGTATDTASSTTPSTTPSTPPATTPPANVPSDIAGLAKTAQDTVTQRIREAITSDTTLATGAKDLQISMAEGKITLRGTVPTEEAKQNIEAKAKQVAGATQVDNQLTVKSAQ